MGLLKDAYLKKVLSGEIVPDVTKLSDGEGLYLELRPLAGSGFGMYWRFNFKYAGKYKTLTFGKYPLITITQARLKHNEARLELSKNIDPALKKRSMKITQSQANNFKTVAAMWLERKEGGQRHKEMVQRYFENDIFPVLGKLNIDEIKPTDIVKTVNRVGDRGALDQARRVGRWLHSIFLYAKTVGLTDNNPADIDLSIIIAPHIPTPHPALTDPDEIKKLLVDMEFYRGYFITKCLLKLAALLMVRPHNLVAMEWSELDLDNQVWTIAARKIKNRQHIKKADREEDIHIVPLSRQAIEIIHELQAMAGKSIYVFPNQRNRKSGHMSTSTICVALKYMGYKDIMTGHGFRALARTVLEEVLGWDEKIAELQLGHKIKTHGGAYDRTAHLSKRVEMMQAWADYLDSLRASAA
ncbi:Integrase [Thiothrix eikelboomii]|uniref:Integrase n=1 Tax=Thiothrix eikelboomii TaxID=92487 RepID=A0A1T4W568_9GAMM|nr:integrase arm-type DNA-binding domain-containing protein [Thiothrix eikelboomii]SKA72392.1 Integrase [Thiothrix eikelboomii]